MITKKQGKVIKGLGGLYEVFCVDATGAEERCVCRAKGKLHRAEEKVLIGDRVTVEIDDQTPDGVVIAEVLPRKNALIRPPMANLDLLFIVFACSHPRPILQTVDKLTAIAVHHRITPVIVITKRDISDTDADVYAQIYRQSGFSVFLTSATDGFGIDALRDFIAEAMRDGKTAAFAGASGVGKSTLINAVLPDACMATAEISRKIERGRHTTRHVELFPIAHAEGDVGFLADTPGFSLIDFDRFDFFSLSDLESVFPDVFAFHGQCRYADCAHVGEGADECAVMRAAEQGDIPLSRLESYRAIHAVLRSKNRYK